MIAALVFILSAEVDTSQGKNCGMFSVCVIPCPTFAFFPLPSKPEELEMCGSQSYLEYSGMKSDIYTTVKAYKGILILQSYLGGRL